jgi:dihydrofolate reductase
MRKIVMFNNVSADGYFTTLDGNLDWPTQDEEVQKGSIAGMPELDAILFGRKTYEMFAAFWPHVKEEGRAARGPHGSPPSETTLEMAKFLNATQKLVFSHGMKQTSWKNSRILGEFDPEAVRALKQEHGKGMIIFGSGSIVAKLTEHGLIDDYYFMVNPVLLGSGRSLLVDLPQHKPVKLMDVKQFKSGVLKLHYALAR